MHSTKHHWIYRIILCSFTQEEVDIRRSCRGNSGWKLGQGDILQPNFLSTSQLRPLSLSQSSYSIFFPSCSLFLFLLWYTDTFLLITSFITPHNWVFQILSSKWCVYCSLPCPPPKARSTRKLGLWEEGRGEHSNGPPWQFRVTSSSSCSVVEYRWLYLK
jgi:hypothetical protein